MPGRIARSALAPILLAGALGVPGTGPATAAAPAVRAEMLPVPVAGPDRRMSVRAVDVSPLGVVAGNALETSTAPDGSTSYVERPQRWAYAGPAGWLRQPLALPSGATSGSVDGLTDLGEAAGSVSLGGSRAVRWSLDGRSTTVLSDSPSNVTAVGPNGPWGVSTFNPQIPIQGDAELVTRDGTRTPLRGTPDLDTGTSRSVGSVGGPDTAIVWVGEGIGQGRTSRPVLWRAGATLRFPVFSSYFLGAACVSRVHADGSAVYSGYSTSGGQVAWVLVRHAGGVPGTDVTLLRATGSDQPIAGLTCSPGSDADVFASDGGVAGYLTDDGQRAAYWDAAGTLTVVPLEAGEQSASGVAVADGGRMVILARHEDGSSRLSLWDDGARTRLSTPRGWDVTSIVELTDAGLLVANVQNAEGVVRPAAWNLAGRA
ncbi:hypothetical protein QLQ12_44075 [Actinoplanes sp. NEAU-A12]|uniref:Uncharacterized protein n=1 Tax=Actinoplanes sandaracinus TaxID=3045177 RepID=A0ABT6X0P8_9ACTN|nr:hypothetical protein [Actinoplanes sandaracinus]MDI6105580.1 hypothetical protein [Actinoplanes sandaracinus]